MPIEKYMSEQNIMFRRSLAKLLFSTLKENGSSPKRRINVDTALDAIVDWNSFEILFALNSQALSENEAVAKRGRLDFLSAEYKLMCTSALSPEFVVEFKAAVCSYFGIGQDAAEEEKGLEPVFGQIALREEDIVFANEHFKASLYKFARASDKRKLHFYDDETDRTIRRHDSLARLLSLRPGFSATTAIAVHDNQLIISSNSSGALAEGDLAAALFQKHALVKAFLSAANRQFHEKNNVLSQLANSAAQGIILTLCDEGVTATQIETCLQKALRTIQELTDPKAPIPEGAITSQVSAEILAMGITSPGQAVEGLVRRFVEGVNAQLQEANETFSRLVSETATSIYAINGAGTTSELLEQALRKLERSIPEHNEARECTPEEAMLLATLMSDEEPFVLLPSWKVKVSDPQVDQPGFKVHHSNGRQPEYHAFRASLGLTDEQKIADFHAEQILLSYLEQVLGVDTKSAQARIILGISKLCCGDCKDALTPRTARQGGAVHERGSSENRYGGVPNLLDSPSPQDTAGRIVPHVSSDTPLRGASLFHYSAASSSTARTTPSHGGVGSPAQERNRKKRSRSDASGPSAPDSSPPFSGVKLQKAIKRSADVSAFSMFEGIGSAPDSSGSGGYSWVVMGGASSSDTDDIERQNSAEGGVSILTNGST